MSAESAAHAERCARLLASLREDGGHVPLGLAKKTSNLFRDRGKAPKRRLDLSEFHHVVEVNPTQGWVDVEGSTTYEELVDAILPHRVMPAVVPQLKTITVGGAAAGVGIEATSFRDGLVHDTMLELEVLLATGEIVVCTPDNEHRDLFYGFPNSYGTLGYALRLRLRTRPVEPFVQVDHVRHSVPGQFFDDLERRCCDSTADFLDGVVFDAETLVINAATFVDQAPRLSDYGFEKIYYRSLRDKEVDYLSVRDYLWRWDTDWFWCSRNVGAEHSWVRRLLGRSRLNSRTYTRVMRWNARWGVTRSWARLRGQHPESVIQDVDIPLPRAQDFLDFLMRIIGILPIWICPMRQPGSEAFPLYPIASQTLYINFGFWDVVQSSVANAPDHFNRLIEREVTRLGGIKSLYSHSSFTREEFASAYGMPHYEVLKARYDPQRCLPGLYEKCVLNA